MVYCQFQRERIKEESSGLLSGGEGDEDDVIQQAPTQTGIRSQI